MGTDKYVLENPSPATKNPSVFRDMTAGVLLHDTLGTTNCCWIDGLAGVLLPVPVVL